MFDTENRLLCAGLSEDELLSYASKRIKYRINISEQGLLAEDGDKFINDSYQYILDREADSFEIEENKKLLDSGLSKKGLLYKLWKSADDSLKQRNSKISEYKDELMNYVWDASFLTKYEGQEFVLKCYFFLLERNPDEEGVNTFYNMLKSGYSKESIIYLLASSKEGQEAKKIKNLNEYMSIYEREKVKVKLLSVFRR